MPEIVGNDTLFVLIALLVPQLSHFKFSGWRSAAILDFEVKMVPYNYHSSVFAMPDIVEKDISFVHLCHLMPELLQFMFFKMASAAILDLEVKMAPKPYNYHSSAFVMSDIVEKDISFVHLGHLVPELSQFMFFKMASAAILNIAQ